MDLQTFLIIAVTLCFEVPLALYGEWNGWEW